MRYVLRTTVWTAICLMMVGCPSGNGGLSESGSATQNESGKRRLVAVSYPLQVITQKLVGPSVPVEFAAAGASDPSQWRPSRDEVAAMQSADLIIANGTGATYANWLTTVSLPDSKRVNVASKGLSLNDFIAVEDVRMVHSHGPEGEHSHATMVSRTWLNPAIASKQAEYLAGQLKKKYPDLSNEIETNLGQLKDTFAAFEKQLADQALKATERSVFTATHDLKFLTQAAGLNDRHFGWDAKTTVQQVSDDLKKAISPASEATSSDTAKAGLDSEPASSSKFILIPSSLNRLMSNDFDEVFKTFEIERIEIDLIDTPNESGDYFSRLDADFRKLQGTLSRY